jgi:hypothetical protein
LRKVEVLKIVECEVEVCYCELEDGLILGEDDDEMMMCVYQQKERMLETSPEIKESHIFETKNLCKCVYAVTEDDEIG